MKIKKMGVLCAMLSLLLLALAGCKAGDLDVSKALAASAGVKSSEGSASVTLELLGNGKPDSGNAAALKYIESLKKVTINLKEIKTESPELLSANGDIVLSTGATIPLSLTVGKDTLTVLFDGASKPYVLNLKGALPLDKLLPVELPLDSLGSNPVEMIAKIMPFIAKSLPNPSVINVEKATEKINNEDVSLNKVHFEIKGDELAGLIKQFIGNILEDEQGLRELVKMVMSQGSAEGGFDFSGIAVEFIKPMLQDLQANIGAKLAETGMANDKLSLKSDLFLDNDLYQRKVNFELSMSLPELEKDGFTGLKVTGTMDKWNLNKPVTADVIDVSKGALEQTEDTKMAHFIKTLDEDSQLYKLLVKDLQVLKKEIVLQMSDDGKHASGTLNPFIKEGNTMVPVRFVTERLDADVKWNNDTREVTITDIMTGKQVVLKIDSTKVLVDGQTLNDKESPEVAPEIVEDSTYVPGAWLAKLFGATADWDNDTRQVTIKKN